MPLDGMTDDTLPRRAMAAEMLDAETEMALARAWRDKNDVQAQHRLINAYMRLAISMAAKYRRYGVSQNDLIQEASLGLMKAVDKFDPDRGNRFSTYAVWWIRASIQDYVMRNHSMVRTGSTASQKALFFGLKRAKAKLEREADADGFVLDAHQIRERIAQEIGVPLSDVEMMEGRLSGGDFSLNATQAADQEGREWIDTLEDNGPGSEQLVADRVDGATLRASLVQAMGELSDRERYILTERRLSDPPRTLESLGREMQLSKERIRQIEVAGLSKMRRWLQDEAPEIGELVL